MEKFTVIIVEDARLELKGTEEIFRTEIPEAEIIGTASNENELDSLLKERVPDMLVDVTMSITENPVQAKNKFGFVMTTLFLLPLYFYAYPYNSFMYGFSYLSLGVVAVISIIQVLEFMYDKNKEFLLYLQVLPFHPLLELKARALM